MQDILPWLVPIVVAHAVVLAVVIVILKRLLLGDARRVVAGIRQEEAEIRKKEDSIRREVEEHEKEFAKRKAEAEDEIRRDKDRSEKEVSKLREQMVSDARKEGERLMEQARRNESKYRAQISREVEEKAVDYGVQVFKLVFSERMGAELHRQFTSELIEALQGIDATNITVEGDQAEFTASQPLDPEQRQRLEQLLAAKFGVQVQVEEKVNPALLAGMILKLGSLEIDGSLLNRYHEAAEELKKGAHEAAAPA